MSALKVKRILQAAAVFILPSLFAFSAWSEAPAGESCPLVSYALDEAQSIRGLKPRTAVPCKRKTKVEVEKYIEDTLTLKTTPGRLEDEALVYKLLGAFPPDLDYRRTLISLYADQIAGFYEPEENYYAVADWMPEFFQFPVAVHELTHALQDQYYHLESFVDSKQLTSDQALARTALVEGDATAVMVDSTRKLQKLAGISSEHSVSSVLAQNLIGAMLSPSLRRAPPVLQQQLMFPYISGLNYCHRLLQKGGYAEIDHAFKDPPESTREILHPGKPAPSRRPAPVLNDSTAYRDVLGEFGISALLGTWLPPQEASSAADGWDGDLLVLLKTDRSSGLKLKWSTYWDSEGEEQEFARALEQAYRKRFGSQGQAGDKTWEIDDGCLKAVLQESGKETSLSISSCPKWSGAGAAASQNSPSGK